MIRAAVALCLGLWAAAGQAQEFTTLKGHGGPIMALAVSPVTGQVASASFDNAVGLWQGRQPEWLDGHAAAVTALAYGPAGRLFSGADDFTVREWRAQPRVLGRHAGKVASLSVSPDGQMLASGSWDGSVRFWPLAPDASAPPALRPGGNVNAVAFGPAGRFLFVATTAGVIWRYDLAARGTDGFPLVRHGFGVNRMIAGAGWLAYGAVDGGTRVIDPATGDEIADITLDRRPILSMAHHAPTGQLAVGDGHGYIMMLDTEGWRITRDFRATRHGPVWALAFSADGSVIHAGGLDDSVHAWPVDALDAFEPTIDGRRAFLRDPATMPNGERQFTRKCAICHSLDPGPSRKAGPTLHGVFGRPAGTVAGYSYSQTLDGSDIVWSDQTIDALFDIGPDHYIPGSKMPMQVISGAQDRADLIAYLKQATRGE